MVVTWWIVFFFRIVFSVPCFKVSAVRITKHALEYMGKDKGSSGGVSIITSSINGKFNMFFEQYHNDRINEL